ncbi:MAG: hypothetical protein L3J36_14535 [Rhodobacteraceae bacterium]|nr:hypothetical protein [Paracoccaceae bacterium]
MEVIDNMVGDANLVSTQSNLKEMIAFVPQIQDKLKIMEAALNQISVGKVEEGDVPESSFGYIPIDLGDFFDSLFDLEAALIADSEFKDADLAHRRVDLVEVGCGSGRNVFLATATDRFEFGKVHGFDLSAPLIEHGRQIFAKGKDLFVADCMEFDYAPYDVVYFYRPFSDEAAQQRFEDRLVDNLSPGAYVIGCGNLSFPDDRRLLAKCENGRLFKKLR